MGKNRTLGLIPFLAAMLVGIATFPSRNTLTYDGALYINIARNLAEDITNFTYQGVYMMYRPPLYPYTLSVFFRVTPMELHLTVARLVSLLSFGLTALLVYLLVVEMLGDRVKAIIASGFYIFNPLAFTMATRELVHSEFTLFYTLSLYMLYSGRKRGNITRIYLSFVSAGLAILTRYTGLSIFGVFLAYLWLVDDWKWVRKKEYWVGFLILAITLAPWLYMGHLYYGGALRPFSVASRVVTLDRPVSVSDYMKMLLQDIGYLLPLLALAGFFRIKKNDEGWLLVSWLFIGLAGILTVTHKETRFITFLSPAMGMLAAEGLFLLRDGIDLVLGKLRGKSPAGWKPFTVLFLGLILIAPVGLRAKGLKEDWNVVGRYDSEVLQYSSEHYHATTLLVSPYLYTMAGFYYPNARIEMIMYNNKTREKIANGYYDLIIHKNPNTYLNIITSGNYVKVEDFYDGKFEIFLRKDLLENQEH
ncbi:glycosyltransferase family 39 protein [Thermococcus sp. MAR1]|uniref:ArnT family glycosyltransferase n=1 Tax=Thermococcus sp. MAR1 TaxID=1638263 RepID=UPI00143AEA5E|nr:glycosyltransferase family 39 protein [Thermococcus sp. MAR1]NJE09748.1 glycosyltransferase family 39 protein [Thermococcus sp. MAR1]